MINMILSKIVDSLDNDPEHWGLCYYEVVRYASRYMDDGDIITEVYDDRIELTDDRTFILNIPEDFRWEIKEALDRFADNELRDERILAEQKIYEVVSGW